MPSRYFGMTLGVAAPSRLFKPGRHCEGSSQPLQDGAMPTRTLRDGVVLGGCWVGVLSAFAGQCGTRSTSFHPFRGGDVIG